MEGLLKFNRLFAFDYYRRLSLIRLAVQATKSLNTREVALPKRKLASLLIKKEKALVFSLVLKIMSPELTNIAAQLRTEEIRNVSNRHIACVKLPANMTVTTNVG